jgi:predicted nuclease of predicted toxin-antitoxin system
LRFLIDENLPFGIVNHLKSLKYDTLDIANSKLRGSADKVLWNKAAKEKRIIITRDLDYPILGLRPAPTGLILLRMPSHFKASQITKLFVKSIQKINSSDLKDKVVVISPGRIRIGPLL